MAKKDTKKSQSLLAIEIDQRFFRKLAIIGQYKDVDLRTLLEYELVPVPLPLFNLDESLKKDTEKQSRTLASAGLRCNGSS